MASERVKPATPVVRVEPATPAVVAKPVRRAAMKAPAKAKAAKVAGPVAAADVVAPEVKPAAAKAKVATSVRRAAVKTAATAKTVAPAVAIEPAPARIVWTKALERAFLEHLASSANVRASCKAAGVSDQTVYRRRQASAAFRQAWAAALDEGYVRLELMMLERAMTGTTKVTLDAQKQERHTVEYPDAVALQLLRQHRGSVRGAGMAADGDDIAKVRARVAAKLDEMQRRLAAPDDVDAA